MSVYVAIVYVYTYIYIYISITTFWSLLYKLASQKKKLPNFEGVGLLRRTGNQIQSVSWLNVDGSSKSGEKTSWYGEDSPIFQMVL